MEKKTKLFRKGFLFLKSDLENLQKLKQKTNSITETETLRVALREMVKK